MREDNLLSHVKRSLLLWIRIYARPCNILYVFHGVCIINIILQAAWNYEISLRVLKNISLVRFAHSWNIFSTFEEEFRASALPYNILLSPDKLSSKKIHVLKRTWAPELLMKTCNNNIYSVWRIAPRHVFRSASATKPTSNDRWTWLLSFSSSSFAASLLVLST